MPFDGALRILACTWLAVLGLGGPLSAQAPSVVTAKTVHYTVAVEGEGLEVEKEAAELGRVLEEAWKQFAEVVHAEPALKNPAAFQVDLRADRPSWEADLRANGFDPDPKLDALCYVPERDLVVVYRQTSQWYTRRLALHGAWQQFHFRAKSKHADLQNTWFVLGLAEELSQHRWDGQKLELAAHPRVTVLDLPKQALAVLEPSEAGLKRFADESLRQPALAWALVSFLRESKQQKYRARFDKLALGQTGSKLTGSEFAASLGKAAQISLELSAWLQTVQEPLEAACGDWEDLDGKRLFARALKDDFAFAVIKAKATEVGAQFELSRDAAAGLVIAWTDKHHYTFAAANERGISVQRCEGDVLSTLGEYQAPLAENGIHALRARRLEGHVTLFARDREIASFQLAGESLGFAVERGSARFVEVTWN